jgi:hypothetical protein
VIAHGTVHEVAKGASTLHFRPMTEILAPGSPGERLLGVVINDLTPGTPATMSAILLDLKGAIAARTFIEVWIQEQYGLGVVVEEPDDHKV